LPRFAAREVEVHGHDHEHDHAEPGWQWQIVASGICLLCAFLGYSAELPQTALSFYILSYITGSWFTIGEVWEKIRDGVLDVHFLMLAVAAGAAAIGRWGEGSVLLFLFSASSALEHFAMDRTQRAIHSLLHSAPKTATVIGPGSDERQLSVEELTPGLRLLVRPGELFPVDGEIARGETAADESTLTGEAVPIGKGVGDPVLAGTLNLNGSVEVTVTRPARESALQKIIHLIQHAQRSKAPSQRFTDRFGSGYTYAVLGATALMFFVWWIGFDRAPFVSEGEERSAFYRAMTLLVVASPCALVLSIPSAILAAIASGARRGILFRGGAAVEQLAEIRLVAMDKTGTLTTGDLRIAGVESFPAGREREVLELAAAIDRHSSHPIARAIVRYAKRQGIESRTIEDPNATFGAGVSANIKEQEVRLGKREWVMPDGSDRDTASETKAIGFSEVWLRAGDLIGRLLLRDDVRPEARGMVESLRQAGLRTLVLTGDRQSTADRLVREIAVDEIRAELKPEQKLAVIEEYTRKGVKIAMVGDGVNDAASIAAAHVGVAMGARGSDSALEQADVVLMDDKLENFLAAHQLSCRARRVIRQNLGISLGVIAILVLFALFERIALPIGVLGHEGSTLLVVLNSLRLLVAPRKSEAPAGVRLA
jgi:Cd2+/Zn2+-exporting ATPase